MRPNDRVTVVTSKGERVLGTIVAIVGAGLSWYKELRVILENGKELPKLPHEKDAVPGGAYWLEGLPEGQPNLLTKVEVAEEIPEEVAAQPEEVIDLPAPRKGRRRPGRKQ